MRLALALVCAALISAGPALAAEKSDRIEIVARIRAAVDACNRKDVTAFARYLTPSPIAVTETPPSPSQCAYALSDLEAAYEVDSGKNAVTEPEITLLRVKDIEISGTHAYVVWPAAYGFKQAGKRAEQYSTITVALEKSGRDWRIANWILSKE